MSIKSIKFQALKENNCIKINSCIKIKIQD